MKAVFWLDEARRTAYDSALAAADFEDAWGDIAPVTFAATAWHTATDLAIGPLLAQLHESRWLPESR
ncbi:hypothetical protein SAMN05421684_1568 [Asanoa ishikariensis]|uniref:Uncharacterized protein n=1 Tax=Asanoa ishikariensis TaxID=137265 RepID=A0A1H3MSS7_9ACTN|nr:hypothetical protein [Asanoa ishikariensis]SDY79119.1 hypothetical protein SAMN05421684_1568 [Asanoa ishikariensis]